MILEAILIAALLLLLILASIFGQEPPRSGPFRLVVLLMAVSFLGSCAGPTYGRKDPRTGEIEFLTAPVLGGKASAIVQRKNGDTVILSADVEEGWADWTNMLMLKAAAPGLTEIGGGIGTAVSKVIP